MSLLHRLACHAGLHRWRVVRRSYLAFYYVGGLSSTPRRGCLSECVRCGVRHDDLPPDDRQGAWIATPLP
jgi:hypothetical protein